MPLYNRKNMPQVNTQNLSKALSMAKSKVKVSKGLFPASKLKESQVELIPNKVKGIAAKYSKPTDMKPLIISKDNYIIDGHHRWAAAIYKFGNDVKIPVHRINLKRDDAIKLYQSIAKSLNEDINVPINVGDTVLGGKFKNKRIVVKSIGKNEKGDITINNKPLMKFRILPKLDETSIGAKIECGNCGWNWKVEDGGDDLYICHKCGNDNEAQETHATPSTDNEKTAGLPPIKSDGNGRPSNSGQYSKVIESKINEIPMGDLKQIDTFADKKLNPVDIVLTDKHFFDRLNDPRNDKEISKAELIGFFKRLAKKKKTFLDFLDKYNQVVAVDDRTNLNIPFMKQANKVIAKTVMRKKDFKTQNQKVSI
jgi:hypothetical protein|tara:strand:- start:790 stop:1890 length:1101 start_codon:yes stop_codon:yes gene_type:complete